MIVITTIFLIFVHISLANHKLFEDSSEHECNFDIFCQRIFNGKIDLPETLNTTDKSAYNLCDYLRQKSKISPAKECPDCAEDDSWDDVCLKERNSDGVACSCKNTWNCCDCCIFKHQKCCIHNVENINETNCHTYWVGTAPFCDGICPTDYKEIDRNNNGDGYTCWTGSKAQCQKCTAPCHMNVWVGSAPFCQEECPTGYTHNTSDKCGDGECCWTGLKKFCVKEVC